MGSFWFTQINTPIELNQRFLVPALTLEQFGTRKVNHIRIMALIHKVRRLTLLQAIMRLLVAFVVDLRLCEEK